MTIDYQVQLIQFPDTKTKESVVLNEDGSYTIFIEASLSHETQQKAFKHAMEHILGEDFTKDNFADMIEFDAHNIEIAKEICG